MRSPCRATRPAPRTSATRSRLAVERHGGLDILVANAGGAGTPAAGETDDEAWRGAIESNLTSAFLAAREALPAMLARGGGSIVVVASEAALVAPPDLAGYTAAKTALLGLTRSLAVDYGPRGVRANAVCPGWVRTGMADEQMDILAAARGLTREEAYEVACAALPLAVPPSRRRSPPSASSWPPASRRSSRARCFPSTAARRPSTSARWRSDPTELCVGVTWRSPAEPGRGRGELWEA